MRSPARRAQRRDSNERPIVDALRDAGFLVEQGGYVCDLMVAKGEQVWLLEVKRPKGSRLTDTQLAMKGAGWPIRVVRTVEEAFEAVGG